MIVVEPDDTARRIREWLRANPGIAKDKYDAREGEVYGHCYVASEAYFYAMGGEDSDLEVYQLGYDGGGSHWFLKRPGEIVDLSIENPEDGHGIPYDDATHRAFIRGYTPSKRAERINDALDLWRPIDTYEC